MTNKEALQAAVMIRVPSNAIDKALLDAGVTATDPYQVGAKRKIDMAAIDLLWGLMQLSSISEGDASESYDRDGIKARLLFLARKYGRKDVLSAVGGRPALRSKSVW